MQSYTSKRVAKLLPTVTKLEAKDSEKKGRESKTAETKQQVASEHSIMSNGSAKTGLGKEPTIELKTGQKEVIVPKSQLVTVNVKKEAQKINYQYKKIFEPSKAYVVTVDPVYEGFENFSTRNVDYEIKDTDLEYLKQSGLSISNSDFEKAVDCFEKM